LTETSDRVFSIQAPFSAMARIDPRFTAFIPDDRALIA
jgi:hypothetical protein